MPVRWLFKDMVHRLTSLLPAHRFPQKSVPARAPAGSYSLCPSQLSFLSLLNLIFAFILWLSHQLTTSCMRKQSAYKINSRQSKCLRHVLWHTSPMHALTSVGPYPTRDRSCSVLITNFWSVHNSTPIGRGGNEPGSLLSIVPAPTSKGPWIQILASDTDVCVLNHQ